jgi:hypothetical protein
MEGSEMADKGQKKAYRRQKKAKKAMKDYDGLGYSERSPCR